MNIWLVEDDQIVANLARQAIQKLFPHSKVTLIPTEGEFRKRFFNEETRLADVIVLDIFLPWVHPTPHPPPVPLEVAVGGYQEAGYRCMHLIRDQLADDQPPIIMYTMLEYSDLPLLRANTWYVRKDSDFGPLLETIQKLTSGGGF